MMYGVIVSSAPRPEVLEKLLNDGRFYIESLIEIETRDAKRIRFNFNPAQEILYQEASLRDLVIKASQLGSTTFYLAKGLRKIMTNPGNTAVVVAHEEFLTQRLLQRVQFMYDSIPSPIKPKMSHSSSYEKFFPKINSTFYIGTAGAKVFGRGEPIHFFLGSEVAFWQDAWRILTPTMQRVPLNGDMILESTPNGEGDTFSPDMSKHNAFFDLVQEALDDPDSVWKLHVLPWWLEPVYRIPLGSSLSLDSDRGHLRYYAEEIDLIKRAGWEDDEAEERIRWRRRKIKEIRNMFWQEFFEDLASCFLAVGLTYYDDQELERMRSSCLPAPFHFDHAEVWNEPDNTDSSHPVYHISVDPGQGKVTRSVATVWRLDLDNHSRVRHEATLSGLYDTAAFAPMVKELGHYYHDAMIAAEANGHGVAFVNQLINYPNVYYRTELLSGITTKVMGWMTTGSARINGRGTKPYMMGQLNELLTVMECKDINIIRELLQVRLSGDQIKFLSSDDFHDSAAIMAATRPSNVRVGARGLVGVSGYGRKR